MHLGRRTTRKDALHACVRRLKPFQTASEYDQLDREKG